MRLESLKFWNRFRLTVDARKALAGYLFTLPFTIGFILFVLHPFLQSILYSIADINLTREGMEFDFIGLSNFRYALFVHTTFVPNLVSTAGAMITNVLWVIIFSFFAALLLNQDFRGRVAARVIFFLPLILSSGIILMLEQQDYMMGILEEAGQEEMIGFLGHGVEQFIARLRMPETFLMYVMEAVDGLADIINASAVQILVFLAGLKSISPSIYEASSVEGASGWEQFWLITLPLLSPLILTNIVYTVVIFFTGPQNELSQLIRNTTFEGAGFGVSSAMSWLYFGVVFVVLGFIFFASRNLIFYEED